MSYQNYFELRGSQKYPPRADKTGGLNKKQPASVTVLLRPKEWFPNLANAAQYKKFKTLSASQYRTKHGLRKTDIDTVIDFAHQTGLSVKAINESHRTRVSALSPFSYNRPANVPRVNTYNSNNRFAPNNRVAPTNHFAPNMHQMQSHGAIGGTRIGSGGGSMGGGFHGGFHGHR